MPSVTVQVGASNGDAREYSGGLVNINAATYTGAGGDWLGWRFTNVTVPKNAIVLNVTFTLESASTTQDPFHEIYGEDADNAVAFTAATSPLDLSFQDISTRDRTSASVTWKQLITHSIGTRFNAPYGMHEIVQEIVTRAGWASGNAMVILAYGLTGTRALRIRNYDNAPADAAELTIEYATDVDYTGTDGTLLFTGEAGSFTALTPVDFGGTDGELLIAGELGDFDIITMIDIEGTDGELFLSGESGEYEIYRWYESPTGKLRADLYSNAGVRLAAAPLTDLVADYSEALGETGTFAIEVPAILEAAALLQHGIRVMIYREGEGAVFYGIVRERAAIIDSNGDPRIVVRGPSSADDLVSTNCLLGRPYENRSPEAIANDLISLVDGWTLGTIGPTVNGLTSISVEGESVLAAFRQLADRANLHLRIDNIARTIDLLQLDDTADDQNRIYNGDFEIGPISDSGAGWEDAISASVDIQTSTAEFHAGAASAQVTALADGVYRGIIQAGTGSLHDRAFGISPGHTVTLTWWLKAPSLAHTYSAYFQWSDEDAAVLSDSIIDATPTSTDWEMHQATSGAAPAGAALVRVGILRKTDAAITFYVDDVTAAVSDDIEETGIRLAQLPAYNPDHERAYPGIIPINAMEVASESFEVWNSLLPVGSGEGDGALTLEHSTRSAPYTIQAALAPDGRALLYLEDSASVTAYGRRQRVLSDKRAVPAEATASALVAASDALYDGAVRALLASKDPRVTYRIRPGQMAHVADGDFRFRLGQRFRVVFRGQAPRADGTGYVYLDVDDDLFLSRFSRRLGGDGADEWDIELTDRVGDRLDAAGVLSRYLEDVWAMQVQPRIIGDSPPTQPPAPELPSTTVHQMVIDLQSYFWIWRATLAFEINQGGGGAWGGTIEINGVDVTADLGGTFTADGTTYTVNILPYLDRGARNLITFSNAGAFTVDASANIRGVRK